MRAILLLLMLLGSAATNALAMEPKLSAPDRKFLDTFLEKVRTRSLSDLKTQKENLQMLSSCLKEEKCGFVMHSREFRSASKRYEITDIPITSRQELLAHMRRQALQFWVYGGLADAENLVTKMEYLQKDPLFAEAPERSHIIRVEPLPGLNSLAYEHDSPEAQMVEVVVKSDITFYQLFNQGMFQNAGVKEKPASDIFGRSEACNSSGCYGVYYYKDFVQPLYRMFLREMVQSQPYLNHLHWDLSAKDFQRALKKSISNIDSTMKFAGKLQDGDRLLLLSFITPTETVLAEMTAAEQAELERILAVIESQRTFWSALKDELKKPEFFGVLGCYGAAAVTPVKILPAICHALGLTVAAHSVYTSASRVMALDKLQQLQLVSPDLYNTAAIGLAVEVALSGLYLREVAPSLLRSFSPLAPGAVAGSGITGSVVDRESARQAYDQLEETLKKLGVGKFFSTLGGNAALFDQLLSNENFARITYRGKGRFFPRGMLTAHEIIGRMITSDLYLMMLGVHSRLDQKQRNLLKQQLEQLVKSSVDANEKVLDEIVKTRKFAAP